MTTWIIYTYHCVILRRKNKYNWWRVEFSLCNSRWSVISWRTLFAAAAAVRCHQPMQYSQANSFSWRLTSLHLLNGNTRMLWVSAIDWVFGRWSYSQFNLLSSFFLSLPLHPLSMCLPLASDFSSSSSPSIDWYGTNEYPAFTHLSEHWTFVVPFTTEKSHDILK